MKKQQSSLDKSYQSSTTKNELKKIHNLLLEQFSINVNVGTLSTYKLLKHYISSNTDRDKFIAQVDALLRSYIRHDATIEYSEMMDALNMADNVIFKIQKEREIHRSVLEKEQQVLDKYASQQKTAYEQIDYLKELLNEQQKQVQLWKKETAKHQKTIQSLNKQLQTKKREGSMLQQSNSKLQAKIAKSQIEVTKLQNQAINLKNQVTNLQSKLATLQTKMVNLDKDKSELSKQYLQKSEEVAKLAQNFTKFKEDLLRKHKVQLAQQIQIIKNEIISADNPELTMASNLYKTREEEFNKNMLFNHLFVGDVLYNEDQHRYFLVDLLQNYEKNAIERTRLLYRWDPHNPTNFHRYIDGFRHIIILIRTHNDCLIGAYSQSALKPKAISNYSGFLISFETHMCFKNIKKAIIYDENQIIFGNYELSIKQGENKVHSNFAASGGFYESYGQTVHTLLGEGKSRQAKIKTYEIYQVIYQA